MGRYRKLKKLKEKLIRCGLGQIPFVFFQSQKGCFFQIRVSKRGSENDNLGLGL